MPQISRFYGIVIAMYYNDHNPPHFHAKYAGQEAIVEIGTLRVMEGKMPRRAFSLVLEWATAHRDELQATWERARRGMPIIDIEPLD